MTPEPVVTVSSLAVDVGEHRIVDELSFSLRSGNVTALSGPSGSGKTTTALALLGEAPNQARLSGSVRVAGRTTVGTDDSERAAVRGQVLAYLPQDPAATLNPARRVGSVLRELAALHHSVPKDELSDIVSNALQSAGMPTTRSIQRSFPHEFSGGQRQRLALAQVIVCGAQVVVLDEPTVGLDPDTKQQVVEELARLAGGGLAVLLLSHDMDVVRSLADEVLWLSRGTIVERADGAAIPQIESTVPVHDSTGPVLLRIRGLRAAYRSRSVVDEFDLDVAAGECVGLVGDSGSGKTTIGRCIAGLHVPSSGELTLDDLPLPRAARRSTSLRRRVQYVWQAVRSTFFGHRSVLDQIAHTAVRLRGESRAAAREEAIGLLERLGVPESVARRRPSTLSGGQLQRAAVVRALLAEPDVLVCDEVTTALDVDTEEIVLRLLAERMNRGMALLLISHDAGVVGAVAHRVVTLR